MTQQGFEDYIFEMFGSGTGTGRSYITAIHILDELFTHDDVFALNGKSLTCIDDTTLLTQIVEFIRVQQSLYQKQKDSFFRNINASQTSYPRNSFCTAAVKQLLEYHKFDIKSKEADDLVANISKGRKISKELVSFFNIDKEGKDKTVITRARIGQAYFRKMVLTNYDNKCCVTGLNVPVTLRASHIVRWADDKSNRMNPENGLCLSATYDEAFDKHLISFDDDYRMIVGKEIKDYYTNEVTREYFEKFEGKQILLPRMYLPSKKLLEKHRNLMIV